MPRKSSTPNSKKTRKEDTSDQTIQPLFTNFLRKGGVIQTVWLYCSSSSPQPQSSTGKRKTSSSTSSTSTQGFVHDHHHSLPTATESSSKKKRNSSSSVGSSNDISVGSSSSSCSSGIPIQTIPTPDSNDFECSCENVKKLFTGRLYVIPKYQRPYEWQPDDVNKLLDDIFAALKRGDRRYFMGNILLKQAQDKRDLIIDGQQRLISLSIILAALRSLITEEGGSHGGKYDAIMDGINRCLQSNEFETLHESIIKIDNDVLRAIPESETFFNKQIVGGDFFKSEDHTKKDQRKFLKYFEAHLEQLEQSNVVYSQSTFQMAKNLLHARFYLNKQLKTQDQIVSFLTYLRNNCCLMVTRIGKEENEFVIFGTLNCRGRDLSPMDILKLEFSRHFHATDSKNDDALQKWINISQEMKEEQFSLLFECIYITLDDTDVTTVRTSQTQRPYDRMLEQLAKKTGMTHLEFVTRYMEPLYQAYNMLKRKGGREDLGLSASINTKLDVIHFISENYFQKAARESSVIMTMILLALYICRKDNVGLFAAKNLLHVSASVIESLIAVWHDYLLMTVLCGFQKVTFGTMLSSIKTILNSKSYEEDFTVLKAKQYKEVKGWMKKIERQLDLSKETTKSEAAQLAKIFEIVLKIIHFCDPESKNQIGVNIYSLEDFELDQIIPKPSGMKRGEISSFLQIGNYTLKKKGSKIPGLPEAQKKLRQEIIYNLKKDNILFVPPNVFSEDKSTSKKFIDERKYKILYFLRFLLGEEEDEFMDETSDTDEE